MQSAPAAGARPAGGPAAVSLDVHDLHPGTRTIWTRGFLVERTASSVGQACRFTAWLAPEGVGTPLVCSHDGDVAWMYFGAHHPQTVAADALSPVWIRRALRQPGLVDELSGVFALVVYDRQSDRMIVAGDRLGVQGTYWAEPSPGSLVLSTHLRWLLDRIDHDGAVDEEAFLEHMGFGYTIDPRRVIYRGVRRIGAGSFLQADGAGVRESSYWSLPEIGTPPADTSDPAWLREVSNAVQRACHSALTGEDVVVGMTAGKDSLCLASALASSEASIAGTFGADGCADRVQGSQLGAHLGWRSVSGTLCAPDEFPRWAVHVAEHSAGLATASYVDMAAFVGMHVPPGRPFVMGEGGECVRDFFLRGEQAPLETLQRDYTTPPDYLRATLARSFTGSLGNVGHHLVARARATHGGDRMTDEEFANRFYRLTRMPGNFAPRNALLSVLRPKLSPFLDSAFIDRSYGVSTHWYAGSRLHRELIAQLRADLLPFFDAPVIAPSSTQEWTARFAGETGRVVYGLLDDSLDSCQDVLDADGVRALCRETVERPSRAIYHLLRVLSFALARRSLRRDAPSWRAMVERYAVAAAPITTTGS